MADYLHDARQRADGSLNMVRRRRASDWPPERVIYELRKKGWSLRRLAVANGLPATSLSRALSMRWMRGEKVIADALGLEPKDIWPDRHDYRVRWGKVQELAQDGK